ncbi:MAG: hypothetical protein HY565_02520 [Candidatus Kerfeldbacteria bacterium]|nr:hypothetical protein [Candidatus Kerfeldbacteria bacterium]
MRTKAFVFIPLLLLCLFFSNAQAETIGTHAIVTNVSMKQLIQKQRLKFTWNKVSTARRYRVKIMHGSTRIARKLVIHRSARFKESKFVDGESYILYVRAKPTAKYAAAGWATYAFTFNDLDHDNDLIPDETDGDDDNDGIPDAQDDQPTDVSGTVYTVRIENNTLIDGTITVQPADSVTWVNKDEGGHSIEATNGSWASPPLQSNESYTHAFDSTGVWSYYDPTYPGIDAMTGTITVQAE